MNIPGVINPEYLNNMQKKVTSVSGSINEMQSKVTMCDSCAALTSMKSEIEKTIVPELGEFKSATESYFKDHLAEVTAALNKLAPLLVSPGDLGGVISWINHMISSITAPYNNTVALQIKLLKEQASMTAKIAALTSSVSSLTSSVTAKSASLNCGL